MSTAEDYLTKITNPVHAKRFAEIFAWITTQFPTLESRIAWNQPMFTDHGTFIIGFSEAKDHINFSAEPEGTAPFTEAITRAGYSMGKRIVRIPDDADIDYDLLRQIIDFNIADKAEATSFWRS